MPLVKDVIAPWFGVQSTGSCVFTAAITLAVMVFPIIISLCIESFDAIPIALKEASLSVGATKWETVKKVVFRASAPGVISAILLGFGRAFGETIAVSMVVGGIPRIPSSLFDPGQTLASLIVSAYGEMMSIPLYESALMMVTLILFIVVLLFNSWDSLFYEDAKEVELLNRRIIEENIFKILMMISLGIVLGSLVIIVGLVVINGFSCTLYRNDDADTSRKILLGKVAEAYLMRF